MNQRFQDSVTEEDGSQEPAPEYEVVKALKGFLDRKHTEELSEFKASLEKGHGMMIQIQNDETGLPIQIYAQGEDSFVKGKKAAAVEKEKRRKAREFQAWIESFQRMSERLFGKLFTYVSGRLESIKQNVEQQIEVLDNALTASKSAKTSAGKDTVSAVEEKRNKLRKFLDRLNEHSDTLEKAEKTEEVLEVETKLEEEIEAFDKGTKAEKKDKKIAAFFAELYSSVSGAYGPYIHDNNEVFSPSASDDSYEEDRDEEPLEIS